MCRGGSFPFFSPPRRRQFYESKVSPMIPSDFFTSLSIDQTSVMARFGGSAALLERFLKKFPADPSWPSLCTALEQQDLPEVERAAHTLKGVAANFGFARLSQACADMVAAVRAGRPEDLPEAFGRAKEQYEAILAKIAQM